MTPERWRQVTEMFHAAIARPAATRSQFLDDACAGDKDLRAEVGAMLAAHDGAASAQDVPVVSMSIDGLELEAGDMVGPYELHSLIGAGLGAQPSGDGWVVVGVNQAQGVDARGDGAWRHQVRHY